MKAAKGTTVPPRKPSMWTAGLEHPTKRKAWVFEHGSIADQTADMRLGRLVATALAFALGLPLGSCGSVSDFVADSWPHFAGGEPAGMPPRPGTPGYAAFIAHGQTPETASSSATNAPAAASSSTGAVAERTPPGNATGTSQAPTFVARPAPAADKGVESGLY